MIGRTQSVEKGAHSAPLFFTSSRCGRRVCSARQASPAVLGCLLAAALLLSASTTAQDAPARGAGRLAPPAAVTCDRNQLTSWTGIVTGYQPQARSTWIEIHTDADTVESTVSVACFVRDAKLADARRMTPAELMDKYGMSRAHAYALRREALRRK